MVQENTTKENQLNLLETLKHYFGYDSLRPGQQELMDGILQGKDVLGRNFIRLPAQSMEELSTGLSGH